MSGPTLELTTNADQYNGLVQQAQGTRKSAKVVKVDRQALVNLLIDHSRLLNKTRGEWHDVEYGNRNGQL